MQIVERILRRYEEPGVNNRLGATLSLKDRSWGKTDPTAPKTPSHSSIQKRYQLDRGVWWFVS